MAQIARPDSDISLGSWSPYPADPTTLFDKINEVTPNGDTDYITSDLDEDECEVGVGDVNDPGVGTGHKIRCYVKSPDGGGAKEKLNIALVENGVVRGISPQTNVSRTAYELIEYTLLEAEANAIQNYANLRLRFHICVVNSNEPIRITQAEFECPDAGEEHSGTGSISGNGSVTGSVKKGAIGSAVKSAGGTLLAIGLAGMLGIASIAGGGAQIVVAKKAVSASVSISGGGSIVATGVKAEGEEYFGTASISGNGALVAGGIKQAAVDVTIGANGVLSGAGEKQSLGDSVVTGGGSVIATGEKYEGEAHSGVAVVSGNGVIDGAVIKQALADLAISANGIFGANGIKQAPGDSTIIGGGSIVAFGTMSESHFGVAIISESGVIDGAGIKQASGSLAIIGGGFIIAVGYGQKAFIEVVKTVFLKSKLTERLVELKSTIKPSIVLNSEIKPEGEN